MAGDQQINSTDDVSFERIESEIEDEESSPAEYEISTYPADFTLEVLHSKWKSGEILIPKFQRKFVWTQEQSSKLIESFLLGLPVPSIFLYTERSTENYLVIDGQQRLRSVFYYFEGQFGEEQKGRRTTFRLKGLNERSKWKNMTFSEMEARDEASAKKLKNCVLRSFVVKQLDPKDDTSIYHIFERLNTGGTLLHNQEVRNSVYGGPFNDLLIELNELPKWRTILGKKSLDNRQRDAELILRFFTLHHLLTSYEKPLKDFMSKFMKKNQKVPPTKIEEYRQTFTSVIEAVHGHLGEKPFHVWGGLNSSVYDSVFCAFASNITKIPSNIQERYERLKALPEFRPLVSGSTTDVEVVKKRMEMAANTLFG